MLTSAGKKLKSCIPVTIEEKNGKKDNIDVRYVTTNTWELGIKNKNQKVQIK